MSEKQFSDFLVQKFLDWANDNLDSKRRYIYRLADNSLVEKLYRSVLKITDSNLEIKGNKHSYITCNDIKIIPLLQGTSDLSVSENYISHLRDLVVEGFDVLENSSLLLIHNSQLDTLVNNGIDLAGIDNIWNPNSLRTILLELINPNDKKKHLSECLLNYRFDQIIEDEGSVFGFEPLYNAIVDDGDLRFDELEMFNDTGVIEMSNDGNSDQVNRRLNENRDLYKRVEDIVEHFPHDLENRLREFSTSFISEHFPQDDLDAWKDVDFVLYRDEIILNRNQKLELEKEELNNGRIESRSKSNDTSSGKRDRHIILIINEEEEDFEFKISFIGGDLLDSQVKFICQNNEFMNNTKIKVRNREKKSWIVLKTDYSGEPTYFTLRTYRDKSLEKYNFNCLVIKENDFYVEAFKNNYLINVSKRYITLQYISINLTAREFSSVDLMELLLTALKNAGDISPSYLKLEITESSGMDDPRQTIDKMNKLTDAGFEIFIDDFGTGQDRTGQDRTGQDRTGQDRTGQDRTGQDRTGQDRTVQSSPVWLI